MSVKELRLGDLTVSSNYKPMTDDKQFWFVFGDAGVLLLDRNQAHLLKLWLEEHLTPNIKKLKDTMGDMQLCGCGLYHHKDWICEKISK